VVAICLALGTPDVPSRLRHGLDSPVMLATCAWYTVSAWGSSVYSHAVTMVNVSILCT